MNSSFKTIMQSAVLILIGFIPLVAPTAPAQVASVAVAVSSAGQGGTGLSYAQSFAGSGTNAATGTQAETQAGAQTGVHAKNPFLDGQIDSSSSSSAVSSSNSGLSSSGQNSAAAQSLATGNAAVSSGLVDMLTNSAAVQNVNSEAGASTLNSNADSSSNANMNTAGFDNRFDRGNLDQNVQSLATSKSQAASINDGQFQNQGSAVKSEIIHNAPVSPLIQVATASSASSVEVSAGNNQGSGSTKAANTVADSRQVGSQLPLEQKNLASSQTGQNQQLVNAGASSLAVVNANDLPSANIGADSVAQANSEVGRGVNPDVLMVIKPNNGIGGVYQTSFKENSESTSSSSHSESKSSSSSSSSSSSYTGGTSL